MKILNVGSLNLDYVYTVDHFVRGGETISAKERKTHLGGKGLNQSIALARAGAEVYHIGCIGNDGDILKQELENSRVDTRFIKSVSTPTGHAIIQVGTNGQNCIIIHGGANQCITGEDVDEALHFFSKQDIMLVQNETSARDYAIMRAAQMGMQVVLNPSPIDDNLLQSQALDAVGWFILNEVEGTQFTQETEPDAICIKLHERYPKAKVVLTLGSDGSQYFDGTNMIHQNSYQTKIVDTTAAGDTFTGYFLSMVANGKSVAEALNIASYAAAIAVSKEGASSSIPERDLLSVPELVRIG